MNTNICLDIAFCADFFKYPFENNCIAHILKTIADNSMYYYNMVANYFSHELDSFQLILNVANMRLSKVRIDELRDAIVSDIKYISSFDSMEFEYIKQVYKKYDKQSALNSMNELVMIKDNEQFLDSVYDNAKQLLGFLNEFMYIRNKIYISSKSSLFVSVSSKANTYLANKQASLAEIYKLIKQFINAVNENLVVNESEIQPKWTIRMNSIYNSPYVCYMSKYKNKLINDINSMKNEDELVDYIIGHSRRMGQNTEAVSE